MPPFTAFERDPAAATGVMWSDFVVALGIWVYCNEDTRRVTVIDAAQAFNTTADLVREAVDEHPWLALSDHDGDDSLCGIFSDGE